MSRGEAPAPRVPAPVAWIACDGSCLGNPGPGGWGAVIAGASGEPRTLAGGEPATTNNRMELTAVIRALEAVPENTDAPLYCDSEYVVKGIREWLPAWIRRGFRTAAKKPVKNQDLWKQLNALAASRPGVRFEWVRGHAGHPGNERAHELAAAAAALAGRRARAPRRTGAGSRWTR